MKLHSSLTFETIENAIQSDDNIGFCISCGEEHFSIEPDAERYVCSSCDKNTVYGAEEILIRFFS